MRVPRDNIITLLTLASYEDSFSLTQIVLKSVERQKQHKQLYLRILFSLKIFLNGQSYFPYKLLHNGWVVCYQTTKVM